MDQNSTQSLYIHIPFCSKKCPYCHFYVIQDRGNLTSSIQKDMLLKSLIQELHLIKNSLSFDKKIISIYWGGGTPSLFEPHRIQKFHEEVINLFPTFVLSEAEVTLEINPDSVSQTLLREYKLSGINRISLGAQSFIDSDLVMLGRTHSSKKIIEVLEWSVEAGLTNISLDLMYDLPHQSLAMWSKNLRTACNLPITHLSLYNLTIEPKTAFFRIKDQLEKKRPSIEASCSMYRLAQEIGEKQNFQQYEISAFAQSGYFSRHNTGYWNGRSFYGLGPSAYSFMNGIRFSNPANLNQYIQNIEREKLIYENIDDISPEKRVRELFCVGLRLFSGVSLERLIEAYPCEMPYEFYTTLNSLIEMSYIEKRGETIFTLTEQGRLIYDTIASQLI